MTKPTVSPNFTVDDIHKIREMTTRTRHPQAAHGRAACFCLQKCGIL
ncbi:MAG: hypothetical protein Ta2A_01800 [Treponemataceae bacterium]|nr:MAG: hypothetical protein Ta2A_01800 [Treponemataceae bacterium]